MIEKKLLYKWCSIPVNELENYPNLKIPFRLVNDSEDMGELMAREFVDDIKKANVEGRKYRAIVPCGPKSWYKYFVKFVNNEKISLKNMEVFHMDECLNWQGDLLPEGHLYNFKSFMQKYFYEPICEELNVEKENRYFLNPKNMYEISARIKEAPIDYTLGGWGQDGHLAYNQAKRNPYSQISIDDLRNSTVRIQENNVDTIITLGQRSFGAAYQFVPPMSITLGMKECLSAKKVRIFSDTGSWKQTALRVALFSEINVEYPMTLLQEHSDAVITATIDTARHPISENPEWEFEGIG